VFTVREQLAIDHGMDVLLVGRNPNKLRAVAELIREYIDVERLLEKSWNTVVVFYVTNQPLSICRGFETKFLCFFIRCDNRLSLRGLFIDHFQNYVSLNNKCLRLNRERQPIVFTRGIIKPK